MEAIEFVMNYEKYVSEIEQVVKPQYLPVVERLREKDPHDIVRPESWLMSESHARGLVWSLFLKSVFIK